MRVQCQMLRHMCGNASGSLACRSFPDTAPPSWCSWCPIPTHGGGSVLTRSRGHDPASSDSSMRPQTTASTVAPCCVVTVCTQPCGR